jgi:hypothetical protein
MNTKTKRRMIAVSAAIVAVLIVVLAVVGGNSAAQPTTVAEALALGDVCAELLAWLCAHPGMAAPAASASAQVNTRVAMKRPIAPVVRFRWSVMAILPSTYHGKASAFPRKLPSVFQLQ